MALRDNRLVSDCKSCRKKDKQIIQMHEMVADSRAGCDAAMDELKKHVKAMPTCTGCKETMGLAEEQTQLLGPGILEVTKVWLCEKCSLMTYHVAEGVH